MFQCSVYMSTKILQNIPKFFLNVPMQRLAQPRSVHKFLPKFDNPASLSSKFSSFTLFCKSCPCSSAWSPNHTEQSPGRVTVSPPLETLLPASCLRCSLSAHCRHNYCRPQLISSQYLHWTIIFLVLPI